jgi:hypothetical protein
MDEEQVVETILRKNHLLVHPGYFYDMDPHHLILSFVQRPEIMQNAIPSMLGTLGNLAGVKSF